MIRRTSSSRDERGAVAILAVILMGLLLIVGALAADMGNAWARKRDMQTQADVAAISAANWGKDADLWPADTSAEQAAITQEAARYILEDNNSAIGMTESTVAAVVAALTDGNDANGDIEFLDGGEKMRLVPPPATVQFGLATAFGYSSTDITAAAAVELFSEVPDTDVVPLYIPDGCAFGAVEADTTGGQPNNSTGPAGGNFAYGASPSSAAVGASGAVTISVPRAESNKNHTPRAVFTSAESEITLTGAWADTANNADTWTFTVTVGPNDITQTDRTWSLIVVPKNNHQSAAQPFVVGEGTPVTDPTSGCSGPDQGNFGQLNSPREGFANSTGSRGPRLMANMLHGLDHTLVPYLDAPSDTCPPEGAVAKHDDQIRDGNNCIKGDTGNDGPHFAAALIGGDGSVPGRLSVSNGATQCGRPDIVMGGKTLNNDDITCFLRDSATKSQIIQPTGVDQSMLDPAIVDSPRFVWIPVVYANDRASHDFQPILKFVPGLITSETTTQTAEEFDSVNGFRNGLECNGAGGQCNSLSRIRIFTFNPETLPDSARNPVVEYDPVIGRETVRLVE